MLSVSIKDLHSVRDSGDSSQTGGWLAEDIYNV